MTDSYPIESVRENGIIYPPELRIARGDMRGHSVIQKFGAATLGTEYGAVSPGGVYQTPQVSGATTLRIKVGGNANDTADGTGAREVTFYGIDATGAEISEAVATAGASASAATTLSFLRMYRAKVTASGTYATSAAGSHAANIVIENGAGGTDWGTILLGSFPHSQSQIAAYTVPLGKTAYVYNIGVEINSTKTVDMLFFERAGILETAPPYSAMAAVREQKGMEGSTDKVFKIPFGPYGELTDIGVMAKGATSPEIAVDFTIVVIDNE